MKFLMRDYPKNLIWPNVEEIALNRTDSNVHASAHFGTKLGLHMNVESASTSHYLPNEYKPFFE